MAIDKKTATGVDPLEHTPLHTLLVNTNRLQALPDVYVVLFIALNLMISAVLWLTSHDTTTALLATLAALITNGIDWALLRALPRTGRSFGPDKPAIIALSVLRTLILAILSVFPTPWWLAALILTAISALVYYSTWVEPFNLGVTHQQYVTPKLKATVPPLRLLQIGDIHVERVTPRERELNRLVKELKPDVIVFTGDFVNLSNTNDAESEGAIRSIIREWQAPLGVYCVPGTPLVEPLERVRDFTKGLDNLRLLANDWATIETPGGAIHVLGMVTTHDLPYDRIVLKELVEKVPTAGMKLLLAHPPDVAPEANDLGVDLYLCGHTHGGQIRLPIVGALFSSSHLGNRFIMGRYELGQTTLYTSRGVGLEGLGAPRARFLCPPEIILWEIKGSES